MTNQSILNLLGVFENFFDFDFTRLLKPLVISGIIVMILGVILLVFKDKLAYEITRRMKGGSDEKMAKVAMVIMLVCLVIVIAGALLAVFGV